MRRSMPSRDHGGPPSLLSNRLQLHDLDLELELLKRKREMIEKQQQILGGQSFNQPRPFDYDNNQPRSNYPWYNEQVQSSNSYGSGGLLGKRPLNDQPWQNRSSSFSGQSGPKRRFNSNQSPKTKPAPASYSNSNNFYSQNRPQWNKPQPAKGPKSNFPSQRFNTPRPAKTASKDFRPTKVGKPKPASGPNKLNSYPTPERAKLVKQTFTPPKPRAEEDPNSFILRENQVPSQQLAGRLELALGSILKAIKIKYSGQHGESFQSAVAQRKMKQSIRERLRSVMMGKYVGKVVNIVEQYRQVFPEDTDAEIVQSALDSNEPNDQKLAIKLENAGNVYNYIKYNLNRLVGVTLDDIFSKVQKLYEHETESTRDICVKILTEELPTVENANETQESDKNLDESKNIDDNETKDTEENENNETEENESKVIQENDSKDEENNDTKEDANIESEVTETGDTETVENEKPAETAENKPVEPEDKKSMSKLLYSKSSKLDNFVQSLLRRRLPYLLPKYKHMIMNVLNASGAYQVTKTAIIEKARDKQKLDLRVKDAENKRKSLDKNESLNRSMTASYLVKILGRPSLPSKKIMQAFLEEYKPTSVKKHRTMALLFVTFENKEDFDKIVAVQETTLGNSTIFIKPSDKTVAVSKRSSNGPVAPLNESTDDSVTVGSDLDEQINDLLLSIRNEEDKGETEADTVSQEENNEGTEVTDENNVEEANGDAIDNQADGDETEEANGNDTQEANEASQENETAETDEAKDTVEELKNDAKESGRATPTRASSRIASGTPSSIRTRRASRLANQ